MACRHLKSSRSLLSRSLHLTLVTKRSSLWSGMTDSHHFCAMSISPPIPEICLFQIWLWKSMVKVMCIWWKVKVTLLAQQLIDLLPFHFTSISIAIPQMQLFKKITLKIKGQGHAKINNSDVKCWNTPGCLDQYMLRGLRLWKRTVELSR